MKNKIHTVIFDLDGTLSDSAVLTMEAFKRVAPDNGLPVPSIDEIRKATGFAIPEFYYILFPDHDRDLVYNAGVQAEKEELLLLPSLGGRLLFEGCRELLMQLKERGMRLCIASTGEREHVFSVLEITGIADLFDTIDCGRPDKTEMLREITGGRNGCVMVGDMEKDYTAARANGIISVGACYGYCRKDFSDFDYYIYNALDLLKILKE